MEKDDKYIANLVEDSYWFIYKRNEEVLLLARPPQGKLANIFRLINADPSCKPLDSPHSDINKDFREEKNRKRPANSAYMDAEGNLMFFNVSTKSNGCPLKERVVEKTNASGDVDDHEKSSFYRNMALKAIDGVIRNGLTTKGKMTLLNRCREYYTHESIKGDVKFYRQMAKPAY